MKKFPSISIALPVYNEESNMERCLSSIFHQKYKGRLEVIIVDGGSKDKTLEIAKKYPVKIFKNPLKENIIGKMIALRKSSGKYFFYLDADIDLPGSNWFEKMTKPLEEDSSVVGSFTGYVSYPTDRPLNRFITLDFLQRDPIFSYLTPKLEEVVVEKRKGYVVCEYEENKMLPAGLVIYRRNQILKTEIGRRKRFNELDNLIILYHAGFNRFAYVENAKLHHPFISSFRVLIRKRRRNIFTMYFDQPDERLWMWANWKSPYELLKLIIWVIYANTLVLPLFVGIYKCFKYKTWVGVFEPVFDLIDTDVIAVSFLQQFGKRLKSIYV